MKKGIVALVIGALLLPASAAAKRVTEAGTTEGDGVAALDVKLRKGKPRRIVEARFEDFPFDCEKSGEIQGFVTFPARGDQIKVDRSGRFRYRSEQGARGNVSRLKGEFKGGGRRIAGSFVFDHHFRADGQLPEEDCTTGKLSYSVRRGAADETAAG